MFADPLKFTNRIPVYGKGTVRGQQRHFPGVRPFTEILLNVMTMESAVKSYLQRVDEPQTADEVARGVSKTLFETEESLGSLVCDGCLVCKEIYHGDSTTKLYWHGYRQCSAEEEEENRLQTVRQPPTPLSAIKQSSRRSRLPFKSPARNSHPKPTGEPPQSSTAAEEAAGDVAKLRERLEEVEKEMEVLSASYSEEELQAHIEKLHEYNEVKDMGQLLLGKIAEVEGTTTAALYERFGLELDD